MSFYQQEQVIYIDLDYNRYALIIRTDSIDEAKQLLTQLLNQLEDQEDLSVSDHRVVLSDIHKGLDQPLFMLSRGSADSGIPLSSRQNTADHLPGYFLH